MPYYYLCIEITPGDYRLRNLGLTRPLTFSVTSELANEQTFTVTQIQNNYLRLPLRIYCVEIQNHKKLLIYSNYFKMNLNLSSLVITGLEKYNSYYKFGL